MTDLRSRRVSAMLSILFGACALLLVIGIVKAPGEAFRASLAGLQLWWQTVFPGLLAPLMLAELLAASGMLHGLGTLGEPLTRRLFRLPGAAGWVIAFGWSAGMPAGAKETARLREQGLVQSRDVDTLLLVSHMPNPFLIVVVVGGAFLQAPAYGWAITAGLWLSAVAAGALWAWLTKRREPLAPPMPAGEPRALLRRAVRVIREARAQDGRPFGRQIGDSVTHAVTTLFAVGGLIMMSAVLLRMLQIFFPGTDAWLTVPGLYEMHLGAYDASRSALFEAAPAHAAVLLAAVLAWSGWSGLLQARAAFGGGAPFPWGRFVAGRLLHAAIAIAFTYPLAIAAERYGGALPAPAFAAAAGEGPLPAGLALLSETMLASLACLGGFVLLALLASLIRPKGKRDAGGGRKPPSAPR
ncbi:nucleoside recognition domain-containing protein [Cohnella nanjingensis]|uniref:Nucleoside recognition domain-containing protein n=1 Tax=Cohnella nanjingensis TaxID=1387779 RepID=A0A7X0S053_9BACL|nr:nucleoside recognition domain-containing protein [Cohnella nanjingensis]MBB6675495.1 nucleoside recognition domain-containing protein [Cohnella nanjingensis]